MLESIKTTAVNSWNDVLSFCADIGMFCINRPVSTCAHRTPFCVNCYNNKLYKLYKNMQGRDAKNEYAWRNLPAVDLFKCLSRKHTRQTKRFRLMSRGEAFSTLADFPRVASILEQAKRAGVFVWVPTRAWRNADFLPELFKLKKQYREHARILCSTDPTTFENVADMAQLNIAVNDMGFSTMFYGDNARRSFTIGGIQHDMAECKKTHKHIKGACATCRNACFSREQRHIHLKQH